MKVDPVDSGRGLLQGREGLRWWGKAARIMNA